MAHFEKLSFCSGDNLQESPSIKLIIDNAGPSSCFQYVSLDETSKEVEH